MGRDDSVGTPSHSYNPAPCETKRTVCSRHGRGWLSLLTAAHQPAVQPRKLAPPQATPATPALAASALYAKPPPGGIPPPTPARRLPAPDGACAQIWLSSST